MIFVGRIPPPAPLDLNDPESPASSELEECRTYWDEQGAAPPNATFKVYARQEVRAALTALFHGKCAYCESPVSGSSQTDVEHYRPKGGVRENPDHPGYWWLAMDWNNLVLSCMHCNQERRQLILDADMTEDQIREAIERNDLRTTGKKNAFPTKSAAWVREHDGDIDTEEPLLIDPTRTDPQPIFAWVFEGSLSTLKPKDDDPRARATIDVLGLNRHYLTQARVQRLNELRLLDDKIDRWLRRIRDADSDATAEMARDAANDLIDTIVSFCDDSKPYAGLSRAFLAHVQAKVADMIGA